MTASINDQIQQETELYLGIEKNLPAYDFIIATKPMPAAEVVKTLKVRVDKARAVVAARLALQTAILDRDTEESLTDPFVDDVRAVILAMYSSSPEKLGEFGVSPRKLRTPLTAEQELIAVEKRAATRQARHTMGPVQKLAIHGDLTGSILVPVTGGETSIVPPSTPPTTPASPAVVPANVNGTPTRS